MPVLAVALLMTPLAASAQESDEASGRALLLILDASGSMDRLDSNGVRLIDGAKQALLDLVATLPADLQVGLRVYGHRYPNTDKANGCTDTELIVPIGLLDQEVMRDAIEGFDARGFTPIGLSLEEAAKDFPPDAGTKAIVLVSDGVDTCAPPDPCEIARGLFAAGIFVRIETVGLVLDETGARDQLQCIAEATGGTYHDVGTIDILAQQLGSIADEAIGGPQGLLFGGLSRAQATVLDTCCPWDEPPADVEGMWIAESGDYHIPIRRGQTLWFSLTLQDLQGSDFAAALALPEGADPEGYLELNVVNEAGEEVAGDREGFGPRRSLIAENPVVWATMLDVGEGTGDQGPPLLLGGKYYVTVTWDAPPAAVAGEVELMVETLEAVGAYAEFIIQERGSFLEPPFELLLGGSTKAGATEFPTEFADNLQPGRAMEDVYRIQIRPGEMLWFRIELEDLQAALVGVHGLEVPGVVALPGYLDLRVFDADGEEVAGDHPGGVPGRRNLMSEGSPGVTMKASPDGGRPELWSGTYYVRVWWDAPGDDLVAEGALAIAIEQLSGQEGVDIRNARQPAPEPGATDPTLPAESVAGDTDTGNGSGSLLPILLGAGLLVGLLGVGARQWARHRR